MKSAPIRSGFSLTELLILLALAGVLGATALPTISGSDRKARAAVCVANLHFYGVATASFTMDNADRLPAYSWRQGINYQTGYADLDRAWPSDVQAQMAQATYILRRLTGRPMTGANALFHNTLESPMRRFTHLIVSDYLDAPLPQSVSACPEDANLLLSQQDPFNSSLWGLMPQHVLGHEYYNTTVGRMRFPYTSTYHAVPYVWSEDVGADVRPIPQTTHLLFTASSYQYGYRTMSQVRYPSLKVHKFEFNDRHNGPDNPFFAYDHAAPNKLSFDLSVHNLPSSLSRRGWDPANPGNPDTAYSIYTPLNTEPAPIGDPDTPLPVLFRFTRGGLSGIDFATIGPSQSGGGGSGR